MSSARVLLSAFGLVLLQACSTSGLAFVQDERIEIVSPESHETVTLPVTISWRVGGGFTITGADGRSEPDAGSFAVFVDRPPVPPGKPLAWLARDDRTCQATTGCPDENYFTDRGVYETTDTSLSLPHLRDLDRYRGHEQHEVTIVLLDGTGKRIGESAFYVSFLYERKEG